MSRLPADSLGWGFLLPLLLQHLHGRLILHPRRKTRFSLLLLPLQSSGRRWGRLPGPADLALQGEGSAPPRAAPSPSR